MVERPPSTHGRRIAVCVRNPRAKSSNKEKNIPMAATLQETLLAPDTQPKVIDDCYTLIEQEVSDKSGVSGAAVKLAYKTVNTFKPGHIRFMVGSLLPEIVDRLQPYWADFKASGGSEFDVTGAPQNKNAALQEDEIRVVQSFSPDAITIVQRRNTRRVPRVSGAMLIYNDARSSREMCWSTARCRSALPTPMATPSSSAACF